jgi:hypothetical protein
MHVSGSLPWPPSTGHTAPRICPLWQYQVEVEHSLIYVIFGSLCVPSLHGYVYMGCDGHGSYLSHLSPAPNVIPGTEQPLGNSC